MAHCDFDRNLIRMVERGRELFRKGRHFETKRLSYDLSHILLCLASVDTVRQLYRGRLRPDMLARIQAAAEAGELLELSPGWFCGVGRLGKQSGYRYRVQDNEEGVIFLVGSYYAKEEEEGDHLKIELAPHFIASRGVKQIQARLNLDAHRFLSTCEPTGCAVHLALDVQGWAPPSDFEDRFSSRARAVRRFDGVSDLKFDGVSDVVASYGKGARETYLFGQAGSLQFTLYLKSKEILVSDKVDYFHAQWGKSTQGEFDPDQPVWRLEARCHQNVLREIAHGMGEEWKTFEHVSEHLTDIWRYCLNSQRLDLSGRFIDPVWQLFRDDPVFIHPANGVAIVRKKKQDQSAIGRLYANIIGNVVSVFARQNANADFVMYQLGLMRFYKDMVEYYANVRKLSEDDLRDRIREGLIRRRVLGKAAGGALGDWVPLFS
jgi:hypothetical protein